MKDCSRASGFPPVIHVVRQYAPAVGGLENFDKALAEQQVRMGLDVTVITLNRGFSDNTIYPDTETINGVRVVRIPFFGSKRYPVLSSSLINSVAVMAHYCRASQLLLLLISIIKRYLNGMVCVVNVILNITIRGCGSKCKGGVHG
ncbi:MAG: hypothetical protein KYX62_11730 [Pseudomonadota bacterium]|nr:hypothetical protein [Pseudomonadota bacterium]